MTMVRPVDCVRRPIGAARRAFSLVELVVVIGIIVLLVGLTVGVMSAINRGSETRTTENILKLLDTAYGEWKTTADRDVSYGIANQPQAGSVYEIVQAAPAIPPVVVDFVPTRRLLQTLLKSDQSKQILANVNSKQLTTFTPALPAPNADLKNRVVDGWDVEIITVFPGRLWVNGVDAAANKDADGTIRTEFEQAFGVCTGRRLRFVSAGPDGRFGNLAFSSPTQALIDEAKDNVYSYPLEAP